EEALRRLTRSHAESRTTFHRAWKALDELLKREAAAGPIEPEPEPGVADGPRAEASVEGIADEGLAADVPAAVILPNEPGDAAGEGVAPMLDGTQQEGITSEPVPARPGPAAETEAVAAVVPNEPSQGGGNPAHMVEKTW